MPLTVRTGTVSLFVHCTRFKYSTELRRSLIPVHGTYGYSTSILSEVSTVAPYILILADFYRENRTAYYATWEWREER